MTSYPLYLNTRDPDVKSLRDFTEKDKIAVPSIKISTQAIMLQMAAAKEWGEANWARLDPLTVSLSHPDGMIAFTTTPPGSTPLHHLALPRAGGEAPGVRTITTNYEILGGRATAVVVASASKFRAANPRLPVPSAPPSPRRSRRSIATSAKRHGSISRWPRTPGTASTTSMR